MSKQAEEFLDGWLQTKITAWHLRRARTSVAALVRRCTADAKRQGIPLQELEAVVIDLEQAIKDEMTFRRPL